MAHPQTDSEKEPISSSEAVSDIESTLPRDATEDEVRTLPKVVDRIPIAAWAAALVGAAERFSYYSTISIWREEPSPSKHSKIALLTTATENYMQNERNSRAVPGALGLGQSTATAISNSFFVFSFVTPMMFAIASDAWLGRYKTLIVAFWYESPSEAWSGETLANFLSIVY
jgi:POT family proton-dependent oligopeptide transporter